LEIVLDPIGDSMAITQPITTKPWHNTGEVQETWKQRCKDFDEWAKKIYQSVYNKPYTTKTIRKKKDIKEWNIGTVKQIPLSANSDDSTVNLPLKQLIQLGNWMDKVVAVELLFSS
jgi:hypothetical protein